METGNIDAGLNEDWHEIIKAATKRGAVMERVHVVQTPWTEYLRFEFAMYNENIVHGERIHLLSQEVYDQMELGITKDFWLFDDTYLYEMTYDHAGAFISMKPSEAPVAPWVEAKQRLLAAAVVYSNRGE